MASQKNNSKKQEELKEFKAKCEARRTEWSEIIKGAAMLNMSYGQYVQYLKGQEKEGS